MPDDKKKIVKCRWHARIAFAKAVNTMPKSYTIRNDEEGYRIDPPIEMDLVPAKEELMRLKDLMFSKNHKQHYIGRSIKVADKISYAPKEEYKFDSVKRIRTKMMRYITRNVPMNREILTERALEIFAEEYEAQVSNGAYLEHFNTVDGNDLMRCYEEGYGSHTCMTGEEAHLVALYSYNECCSLITYDNGEYEARALLWQTDQGPRVMDRVYPNSGRHLIHFINYAKKKGYIYRVKQDYPSTCMYHGKYPTVELSDGETYTITLDKDLDEDNPMPYMDTWHWIKNEPKEFIISNTAEGLGATGVANSTSGEIGLFSKRRCGQCDIGLDRKIDTGAESIGWTYTSNLDTVTCRECTETKITKCEKCSQKSWKRTSRLIRVDLEGTKQKWCYDCKDRYARKCPKCLKIYKRGLIQYPDYNTAGACEKCLEELDAEK